MILNHQLKKTKVWIKGTVLFEKERFPSKRFGKLVVNWNLGGEMLELELKISVGVEAEVVIPASAKSYKLNDKEYELTGREEKVVRLKSGKYSFQLNS